MLGVMKCQTLNYGYKKEPDFKTDLNYLERAILELPKIESDIHFFSKLVERIKFLTDNKVLYRNNVVFYGKKVIQVQKRKICLHVVNGKVNSLDYLESDGSCQTFKV